MRSGDVASVAAAFVVAAFGYFLLAGQVSVTEIIACVPVAALAAAFSATLLRAKERRFHLRRRALLAMLRAIGALLPDAVRVGRMLLARDPAGQAVRQPFRRGGNNEADASRRAVVSLGVSLAPNSYVLCMDGELLVHRLAPGPSNDDLEWPV